MTNLDILECRKRSSSRDWTRSQYVISVGVIRILCKTSSDDLIVPSDIVRRVMRS